MKRFFAFIIPWALFILNLPDIAEKVGKWIPILNFASNKLTGSINALIAALPRTPGCGNCFAFYWFWPTILSMALIFALYILFYFAYAHLTRESLSSFLDAGARASAILFFATQLLVIYLVQAWLLFRYSSVPLLKSLTIITFNAKVAAAHDKNFFLHASNIYGVLIIASYLTLVLLSRWAWIVYKRNPKAKPPDLG
jgi:hypothetical protein